MAPHKLILRLRNELLAYYTPFHSFLYSLLRSPKTQPPTHLHLVKISPSILISLQAKWSVLIYCFFSFCRPSISYCLRFSLLVSLKCIFSQCNALHRSLWLRFHLAIFFSVCFTFSLLPALHISFVLCLRQSNPSDFKNHIIQSGPTQ